MRRDFMVLALGMLLGCSGNGPSSGDGGGNGGGGGGSGGAGAADAGSCSKPLSQANFCQANFTEQVTAYPCDDQPNTTRMCGNGTYKLWDHIFIDGETCVYNADGTALLGARTCGTDTIDCPAGCATFGISASAYAPATCGADSMACP